MEQEKAATKAKPRTQETNSSGLKLALAGYTVLFVGKLVTYFMTGIGVMYAEALHSLADMLISGFLLIALIWARKPADREYRFGYGRAENVAALVAATVFISFTSLESFRSAIPKLTGSVEPEYSNLTLGLIVTGVAIVISALPLFKIWFSKAKGAASKAQFIESINDEIALLAALIGIFFIKEGVLIADGIASIVVAVVIAVNAGILWWENARTLMGRSPDSNFYQDVQRIVTAVEGVKDVHDMQAEYIGNGVRLDLHVEVPWGTPIERADKIAHEVEAQIITTIENAFCTVHVDPEGVKS
ncbi:MAG TPA: cation diffusion facilitator family transporter [Candidatus Aquicultor sp.]|jgi:ferrous-iron efflux pump FieF